MRKSSLAATLVAASVSVPAVAADVSQSGFSPLYRGVDFETATVPSNPDASGNPTTSRFAPCCDVFAEPKTVIGLLVSQGKVVTPLSTDPLNSAVVLAISKRNQAVIAPSQQINVASTFTAIAGSALLVQNGQDVSASSPNEGDPKNPNPRPSSACRRTAASSTSW